MRTLALIMLLGACSIPDKQALTDGGTDAPLPPDSSSTAPDTRITDAPTEFSRLGAATFAFDSDDPSATFECSIDEETPVACSSPYTRTLGDGPHGFVVRAVTSTGNSDDTPAEHRWTIDTVAPQTTLISKPPLADNSVTVRFDFDSNETTTFECALDAASFFACAPMDTTGPLTDGAHSFSVRAIDRAGNIDITPAVYAWVVDTSTPDTQILSGPVTASASTGASFTFVSPDAGGGATFECSLDGAAFLACSSPITYTNLAERMHRFMVRVRDVVGNVDPTPATRDWAVDLTAPTTTITSGPTGATPSASATFLFTASEDSTFECALDNAAFTACTSPLTQMQLAQGAHTFAVRAIDLAGHVDATPATSSWTVDTVAPDVAITAGPAQASTSGPRVIFSFTVSEGAPQCSVDADPFTACTSPLAFNASAGGHQVRIRATDAAGNVSTTTRAWTIACAAPAPAGAAGLLHLDDTGQTLANDTGGAAATLGNDATIELSDPTATTGRFAGGLSFAPAETDRVAWPALLGPTPAFTLELWSRPDAAAGTRDIFVSGDGRIALRVTAVSPTTVQFTATVVAQNGVKTFAATSAEVIAGAWHHVLASLAEPDLRLWVDGVRTGDTNVNLGAAPVLDAITLGGTYSGSLDEVWLAQTAITTDEPALQRYCPL